MTKIIKFLIISENPPDDMNKMFSGEGFPIFNEQDKVSHIFTENNKLISNPPPPLVQRAARQSWNDF